MELRYNMDDSPYLEHYGVLGMKWGIRRNPEKTAVKVRAQLNKDRAKAAALREKAYKRDTTLIGGSRTAKYAKYAAKKAKYDRKANSWFTSAKRRAKFERKSQKMAYKMNGMTNSVAKIKQLTAKAYRLDYKADKLERAYNKQLKKLEQRQLKAGQSRVASVFA